MTWFTEKLHDAHAQQLKQTRVLVDMETGEQKLTLFENPLFGRVLTLDGVVQVTEGDEFIYHEMLTHVPILAHGAAREVLIIGGGDGGMAREALRHPHARVTMVEIDEAVVAFSKEHLPGISNGAFDDPRLRLVIADGAAFLRETEARYDVIIVDGTDPVGPGEALFEEGFYASASRALATDGILVTQNGVPFLQGEELTSTMTAFQKLFADATCYLATVPTYAGGPMAFGWGTNGRHRFTPLNILQDRFAEAGLSTRYYTPEVHIAAFALPGYISRLF